MLWKLNVQLEKIDLTIISHFINFPAFSLVLEEWLAGCLTNRIWRVVSSVCPRLSVRNQAGGWFSRSQRGALVAYNGMERCWNQNMRRGARIKSPQAPRILYPAKSWTPRGRTHEFYRAMHFSAERGLAIAWRPSVHLWRWWIVII